jgi:hypothetical protein
MRKAPLVMAAAAILGLTAVTAPSPAERLARARIFPAGRADLCRCGDRGLASNAYAYGPGYGYYGGYRPQVFSGYAPAYYGGYYGGGYADLLWRRLTQEPYYPLFAIVESDPPGHAYCGGPRFHGPQEAATASTIVALINQMKGPPGWPACNSVLQALSRFHTATAGDRRKRRPGSFDRSSQRRKSGAQRRRLAFDPENLRRFGGLCTCTGRNQALGIDVAVANSITATGALSP